MMATFIYRVLLVQSMRLAAGLALLKVAAGLASGSLGVLASALDSLLDISASAVNYMSLDVSEKPPDSEHPYGHGKAEALAGLFQGVFVAVGGAALLTESVRRFLHDTPVHAGPIAIGAMVVSIAASAHHSRRLKEASQKYGSMVMRTETAHFAMDILANGAILGALLLVRFLKNPLWDLGVCVVVTLTILKQALGILAECVQELMDHGLSAEKSREVVEIIRRHHPAVAGLHNFRARKAGGRIFVDFHVELKDVVLFKEAHDIAESLVDKVKDLVPGADVTVHYDPKGER